MDERVPGLEMVSAVICGVEAAMKKEGVSAEVRERVVNRLIWGEPEGLRAVRDTPDPDEQAPFLGGKTIEPFGLR